MAAYTIKSISGRDVVVEFELSDLTKSVQTLAGAPIDGGRDEMDRFMGEYLTSYEKGLSQSAEEKKKASQDITAIINEKRAL